LGHISLTRKIVSEYDLYCVEWDVKPYYTILYHTVYTVHISSTQSDNIEPICHDN